MLTHDSIARRALEASLAGFFFSLLLSALITVGLALNLAPLKFVERSGIDASMQLFAGLFPRFGTDPSSPSVRYAYLDVNEAMCRRFHEHDEPPCGVGKPIGRELILAYVEFARASEAAVAILDVALPTDAAFQMRLRAAFQAAPRTWFIVPSDCRPVRAAAGLGERCDLRAWRGAASLPNVRTASFRTGADGEAADGVIRDFPMAGQVLNSNGAWTWLPSAPYAAAWLPVGQFGRQFDCAYYGTNCGREPISRKIFTPQRDAERLLGRNRVFFTLPWRPRSEVSNDLLYAGLYERYEAFAAPQGRTLLASSHFKGATLILGSSAADGLDLHPTPLGDLSGAELILNATRAFRELAPMTVPATDAPFLDRLGGYAEALPTKAVGALVGAVVFFPIWLLIFTLVRSPAFPRLVVMGLVVAAFAVGLVLLLGAEVTLGLLELRREVPHGRAVDLLTPMLAIGLEGYAEAAKSVSGQLERLAAKALATVEVMMLVWPWRWVVQLRWRAITWIYVASRWPWPRAWRWPARLRRFRASLARSKPSTTPAARTLS